MSENHKDDIRLSVQPSQTHDLTELFIPPDGDRPTRRTMFPITNTYTIGPILPKKQTYTLKLEVDLNNEQMKELLRLGETEFTAIGENGEIGEAVYCERTNRITVKWVAENPVF